MTGSGVPEAAEVVRAAMNSLSPRRPIFHSEADFQHALAWQIQLEHSEAQIRLETRPLEGRPVFLDLAVTVNGKRIAIELKYLVTALSTTVNEEHFELRPQSAHDVRRYDVIKDICRVEECMEAEQQTLESSSCCRTIRRTGPPVGAAPSTWPSDWRKAAP